MILERVYIVNCIDNFVICIFRQKFICFRPDLRESYLFMINKINDIFEMDIKFLECQLWFTQQNCLLNVCPNEIIFNDYDWIILRLDNFIIELQRYWSWIENNSGLFSFYLIFFSTEIAFAFLHTCVNVCGCATHIYYELHFPDYVWRLLLHWPCL